MPQPRSGYLTILPNGKWYLHDPGLLTRQLKGKRIAASVGPHAAKKSVILGLPQIQPGRIRTKINLKKTGNGRLKIGPIIGILTVGEGLAFRGNRDNFRDIILCGNKLGALVYVFTPGGIDWQKKIVRGMLFDDKQNTWLEATLPFPQVVYNRIPTRKWEKQSDVSQTLEQLSQVKNLTLFNISFFNKLELFQILEKKQEAAGYLPETKQLTSFEHFKSLSTRYACVYLKPVTGKAGEGIMRLDRSKNRRWRLMQVHEQESRTRYFSSLEEVWRYVQQYKKQRQYIIQQGITLSTFKGRPFDVRVLVQKNGAGEWDVTGIGIRRAGANSITTHVPRGGSVQSASKVLSSLYGEKSEAMQKKISETALTITRHLNQHFPHLAEMSMDLGLTRDGHLWFFEANAKPEKFDEPTIRIASLTNLIQYAQHVCRLAVKKDKELEKEEAV